jgi:hypothetical protein
VRTDGQNELFLYALHADANTHKVRLLALLYHSVYYSLWSTKLFFMKFDILEFY